MNTKICKLETLRKIIDEATPFQGREKWCEEIVLVGTMCLQLLNKKVDTDKNMLDDLNQERQKVRELEKQITREKRIVNALLSASEFE